MALGTSAALTHRRSNVLTIADVPTPQPRPDTQFARARPLSGIAEWYAVMKEKVRSYAALADDWNGEGASAIGAAAMSRAEELLRLLRDADAPRPFVAPLAIGGIGLEWEAGMRELTLNVRPDGSLEFVRAEADGEITDGESPLTIAAIRRHVSWLRGEP
jgi:hypothetical protein